MARCLQTAEEAKSRNGLIVALREKYRLFVLLAVLGAVNLASQNFRGHGLNGKEMLLGTLILAAALVMYACVRAAWDVKVRKRTLRIEKGRQDHS